jgi:Fe-Mn family superoxide dismutase
MRLIFLFLFAAQLFAADPKYIPKNYSYLIGSPGFSDELLEMHFKLYEGYVKNTNELLSKIQETDPNTYEFGALKRRLGWEFDGMRLHELYFGNLGGKSSLSKKTSLHSAIASQFGGFNKWKKEFIATGMMRGIGWSVLYLDLQEGRLINTWINEHDVGHLAGGKPILIMDVFEHAYMPQYGLDKAKYIEAFFNNINWDEVAKRYSDATGL